MIPRFKGDFLQWLRGFYAVATTRSITNAAALLDLSKPAVTHQLKELEKALGVRLFTRTQTGMLPTAQGLLLLERTEALFGFIAGLREDIARSENPLVLACNHFMLPYLASRTVSFGERCPGITIRFSGGDIASILHALASGEADMALLPQAVCGRRHAFTELFRAEPVLVTARSNPFGLQEPVPAGRLAGLPLLAFPGTAPLQKLVEAFCAEQGISLNISQRQQHFATIMESVEQGQGVALIDRQALLPYEGSVLAFNLPSPFAPRVWGIVRNRERRLRPGERDFLRWIGGSGPTDGGFPPEQDDPQGFQREAGDTGKP